MAYPAMEDVKKALEPHHAQLRGVVEDAWGEWRQLQEFRVSCGLSPVLYSRTISNYVFDAIARRAIPLFGAEQRVSAVVESQTFKLAFRGVVVRYKKGGEDGLGCNIPTQAALAFVEVNGVLPGLPPKTAKVEIIWLPNDIWTRIEHVLVVARDGDTLLWQYAIDASGEVGETVVQFQPPDQPADGADNADLVKPKTKPSDKPKEK